MSGIAVRFGAVRALDGVDLAVRPGEVVALAGENGAGKTTLVRCIAGDIRPSSGEILFDGKATSRTLVAAPRQGIAVVWQDLALADNLDIASNLLLGRETGWQLLSNVRLHTAAAAVLAEYKIPLRDTTQSVGTLSGGQRQLVAVARAMARRPKLLLLDEPLTNLDAKLRHDTRAEFKRLHRELRDTTIIYATPDQIEALSMGQRIGVLREGRIVQVGAPQTLYTEPRDEFVASLVGDPPINLIAATLKDVGGKRTLALPFVDLDAAPWRTSLSQFPSGARFVVGVRPQAIAPVADGAETGSGPKFSARVFLTEPLGDVTILNIVANAEQRLKMVLPQERAYGIAKDASIECALQNAEICLFAQETGTAIRRNGASPTN